MNILIRIGNAEIRIRIGGKVLKVLILLLSFWLP